MKRLILILIVVVLMITGCSKTKKQVVEQSATPPSATENTTAAITATDAMQTTEDVIQIDTPSPQGFISEYHPIIMKPSGYDIGILLGGFNQKWLNEEEISAAIEGNEEYKLCNFEKFLGTGIGDNVIPGDSHGPYTINIRSDIPENDEFLAVSCDWDLSPRAPVQQSTSSEEYNKIISKILEENGLKDVPVNIVQNYRLDIEGDGQDEVLLYAQKIDPTVMTFQKNTYSLLILRKIIDGKVENIFLRKEIHLEDEEFSGCPSIEKIEAIADLDGDGQLEIVTSFYYYEGDGYCIYDLVEDKINLALQTIYGGQ